MVPLFGFTIRQILTQRKLALTAAILLFPAAVVVLVRSVAGPPHGHMPYEMYHVLTQFVLLMVLIPLICLLYGTALIGAEIEQRTLVYLITRRLHRATVLLVRFAATWLTLTLLFILSMAVLYLCLTAHPPATTSDSPPVWPTSRDLGSYVLVAPVAAAAFLALFTAIGFVFSRPLIVSLLYIVVFELVLGNLPVQARRLSISHLLRQTLVDRMPEIRRLYNLPNVLTSVIYPPGESGTWALLILVAALLGLAAALMTVRELVPARISRD